MCTRLFIANCFKHCGQDRGGADECLVSILRVPLFWIDRTGDVMPKALARLVNSAWVGFWSPVQTAVGEKRRDQPVMECAVNNKGTDWQ